MRRRKKDKEEDFALCSSDTTSEFWVCFGVYQHDKNVKNVGIQWKIFAHKKKDKNQIEIYEPTEDEKKIGVNKTKNSWEKFSTLKNKRHH